MSNRRHQSPHIPKTGDIVAKRFRIGREIGEGGFSIVFEATQLNLQRRVALKMLLPEILGDSYNLKLFKREAQFAKSLRHPYIIELYDYGETHTGLPFIVMEYLEGEPLGDIIGKGPVDEQRLWKIIAQTLKALMAAHRQGVVHRDIKPSNIFVCDYSGMADFVKVIDFGIAKAFTGPGENSTSSQGKLTGTPHYMAPEQISGQGLGPHTDIYALGLVMAEALTGRSVYHENTPIIEVLQHQMSPDAPPIPEKVLAGRLGKIIARATRKSLEGRYKLASQMLEDVEKIEFGRVSFPSKRFVDYTPPSNFSDDEPQPGTVLTERWRLDELLSRRPFTLVYKATQLSLDRHVAIKMLRPEATQKPNIVEHFQEEMRIVRQLDSPHTIRIVDYGETASGLPFTVMEWLKGLQLSRVLVNVRLLPAQVISLAKQLLISLREAHNKGIFHRDIRPTSIFLCNVGMDVDFAKLTDFGRPASQIGNRSGVIQLSDTNQILGAPHYMAPEQLLQGHVGAHTDIYALGLVMAEALVGHPIFDPAADPIHVARAQASDAPPPIPSRALQGHLGAVIERATRKELALRYTSVDEMLQDLQFIETSETSAPRAPDPHKPPTLILTGGFKAIKKPELQWRFETRGHLRSAPVLSADGTIYVGSFDGALYAIYPNGQLRWAFQTQGEIRAAPALDGRGTLYIGSRDARIYAISTTGQQLWAYETVGPVNSSPVVGPEGIIYVGSGDRYLYALRPDGTPEWFVATRGPISSTPALGPDGTIYVGSEDQRLYAIDPSGQVKWKVKTGGRIYGAPATNKGGTVYVGSEDENLYALSPAGEVLWTVQMEFFIASTPVIADDDTIYIGANDGTLYAIDPAGRIKWTFQTGDAVTAAPNLDNSGNIYLGSNDGLLYSIDPQGNLNWTYPIGDWIQSSPTASNEGTVYVGADDGNLYAIQNQK